MKLLWGILTLIPAAFLFHFYEYGQSNIQLEASILFSGSILFVLITGALATKIRIRYIILVNIIAGILSFFLAMYFIPDDGAWFKPLGRDMVIVFTAIVFLVGQLIVRLFSRMIRHVFIASR